ncbi:O-antigen ligase family protein [Microbacterium sp. CIAB417]|uniref:O-antigen ligase family protein n=1 Tax=Microbacterium sp. CIAB417 TaxID=2860287 RepID=UPI001FAE0904|nr:O-antigen ligase family protein [Microbacterium sp. CIAB417]
MTHSLVSATSRRTVRDATPTRLLYTIGILLGLAAAVVGVRSPVPAIPLRPWHLLVLLALLLAVHVRLRRRAAGASGSPRVLIVDIALILYILGTAAVEVYDGYLLKYSAILNGLIEPTFWFLAYMAARTTIGNQRDAQLVLRGLIIPIFLAAPLSFAQALNFGPAIQFTTSVVSGDGFASAVEDGNLLRAAGLVGGWTSFGAYVTGVFTAAIALLIIARERNQRSGIFPFAVIGLCILALLTTLTFSTTIAFVVILLGTFRRLGVRPGFLFAIVGAAIGAALLFGPLIAARIGEQYDGRERFVSWLPEWVPNTIGYRVHVWIDQTIPTIMQRPITGWGYKVYDATFGRTDVTDPDRVVPKTLQWTSPESQWFAALTTGGVLGLGFLLLLIVALGVVLWRGLHRAESSSVAAPVWWLFVANVGIGFTAISITNKGLPGMFWPLVGIVAALTLSEKNLRKPDLLRAAPRHLGSGRE